MRRAILRNILRNKKGSNKIRLAWRKMQIGRMGWRKWLTMFKRCKSRGLSKDEIYMV